MGQDLRRSLKMNWYLCFLFVASVSSLPRKIIDDSTTDSLAARSSSTTSPIPVTEAPSYTTSSTERSATRPSSVPGSKPPAPQHYPLFNYPKFPFVGYKSAFPPVAACPPCPCKQQYPHAYPHETQKAKPDGAKDDKSNNGLKEDHPANDQQVPADHSLDAESRQRRGAPGDYYQSLGKPNYGLNNFVGYSAVQSMQDQFDRYGPTLHMGKISSSDFNYPDDFHLFTTPGRNQDLLIQSGFYLLNGPLTVSIDPTGDLVGPIADAPATFNSALILVQGTFRVSAVQKNDIFKMQDPDTGVIFIVNCRKQSGFASCNNLKKIH